MQPYKSLKVKQEPREKIFNMCATELCVNHIGMSISSEPRTSALRSIMPTGDLIKRARRRLHLKSLCTMALFTVSYAVLVLLDTHWFVKVLAAVSLVHAILAIATGIMHDANHGAFSRRRGVNHIVSYSADFLGASSWLWRMNHNVSHHHWTNVVGHDDDIELAPFARLAPGQRLRPWHKYQHLYLWFLYGFLTLKWMFVGDFLSWSKNRESLKARSVHFWRDSAIMILGKLTHLTWALLLPMMLHPVHLVLLTYLLCSWVVGFALAVIFQLAHCVEGARFVLGDPGRLVGDTAMEHQLATTIDFDNHPRALRWYATWLLGGLDHQVEHHLAPRLPHTIYRSLAANVDSVCETMGWVRNRHRSLPAALAAHARHLYVMGRAPVSQA
jgi:linoleoyl-CoA desaturase